MRQYLYPRIIRVHVQALNIQRENQTRLTQNQLSMSQGACTWMRREILPLETDFYSDNF